MQTKLDFLEPLWEVAAERILRGHEVAAGQLVVQIQIWHHY